MAFISQSLGGATQYDGLLVTTGLVTFDLSLFLAPNYVPRIDYLSLTLAGAAAAVLITVALNGTAVANRAPLVDAPGNMFVFTCPITLGKAAPTDIHQIFVVTTGKTGQGVLEVVWHPHLVA